MMTRIRRRGVATLAFLPTLAIPSVAAAVPCNALPSAANPDGGPTPHVLYVEGANAVGPLIALLQQALSLDPNPLNVVYIGDGGCVGATNFAIYLKGERGLEPVLGVQNGSSLPPTAISRLARA